jgi:hypothetical protein
MKRFLWLAAFTCVATFVRGQYAPTIVSQSPSTVYHEGQSLTLSVEVNGTTPFTYQWEKDDEPIPGATRSSYSIESLETTDAGVYTVAITNAVSTTLSDPIVVDVAAAAAPVLNYQPSSLTLTAGETVWLGVSVSGTSPFRFVWKRGTTVLAETTSSSYQLGPVSLTDSGAYSVTISNAAGVVTSNDFSVTVNAPTPPVFTSHPSDRSVFIGGDFTLSSWLTNSNGVTFQWYKDDVAISGAVSREYWLPNFTAAHAGTYRVKATNAAGSTWSNSAVVSIRPVEAPTQAYIYTSQISATVGDSFNLNVSANGSSPLSYQWKKDGSPIAGAVSSGFYSPNIDFGDTGIYSVTVSNSAGSITSNGIPVIVKAFEPRVILAHPASRAVYPGVYVGFEVSLTGNAPVTFQWKKDGVAIPGATWSSYGLPSGAVEADEGEYSVVITQADGTTTSETATLTVLPPVAPEIQVQPADQSLEPGETIQLWVNATGHPAPSYQWFYNGEPILGATSQNYYKQRAASSLTGEYTVQVTNSAGSVMSEVADVNVSEGSPPAITLHPDSCSVLPSDYVSLDLNVISGTDFSVQWFRDDVAIPGATSTSYYFTAQPSKAGTYKAVVTNFAGTVTSKEAVVTVDVSTARPVIIRTAGSRAVDGGGSTYLWIGIAPGVTPNTIVWKKDGQVVPNATAASLTIGNFTLASAGVYTAEVTTAAGTFISRPIELTLHNQGVSPVITRSPASVAQRVGQSASFQVQVRGESPMEYQWKKNGINIPNATSGAYQLWNLTAAHAGDYAVEVTNSAGSVVSAVATLVVEQPGSSGVPTILRHPSTRSLYANAGSAELSVQVADTEAVTYQWYKDEALIPNATSAYHYVSASDLSVGSTGSYKVVVTNAAGSSTSETATVTRLPFLDLPTFTLQPGNTIGYLGHTVTFKATAVNGTITYQWRKDGEDIPGATSSSLPLADLKEADEGTYSVIASNTRGHVSSTLAVLTLEEATPPTITQQPQSQYAVFGGSVTFTAAATGVPDPTFQWRRDGTELTGATDASLTLNNLTPSDAGTYTVVASNPGGSVTSSDAVLQLFTTLPTAPAIADQPDDLECGVGDPATLAVQVTGTDPLSFQWYKDGTAISGATETTLMLEFVLPSDVGEYHVVATNPYGSAESTHATLTVTGQKKVFFGTLSTGESWALQVHEDGTATFLGYVAGTNQIIFVQGIVIAPDGSFSFGGTTPSQSGARKALALPVQTAALADQYFGGQITGQIVGGSLTGQIAGSDVALSGTAAESTGLDTVAGIYDAVPLGTNVGEIHAMVAPNGSVLLVEVNADGVRAGVGTVDGSGAFSIEQPEFEYSGTLSTANQSISGSYIPADGAPVVIAPTPSAGTGAERLSAVSTRSFAGTDANTLIAGFVISGSAQKDILLRAVGPTLSGMGVTGALADPRLVLYRGQTMIRENDNWSTEANGGSEAAEAAARLGGFALPNGSADAAMLARLDPGVYTAHVTSTAGATGVALLEVYDASPAAADAPKVLALSTRGSVSAGDGVLIVGFVIEGAVPKKVLVRGVGPSLASNVSGALTDPKLQLFKGSTVIAQNDDWSAGSDAAEIETATASSGASPLASGSKDSALLVYLAPGVYTAHISGVGGATGVALAEIYEVP